MKMFGVCINRRVVAGIAVTAAVLWWLAPGAVSAAWPLLAFAVCPLSMLLMMKAMDRGRAAPAVAHEVEPHDGPAALDANAAADAGSAVSHDRA